MNSPIRSRLGHTNLISNSKHTTPHTLRSINRSLQGINPPAQFSSPDPSSSSPAMASGASAPLSPSESLAATREAAVAAARVPFYAATTFISGVMGINIADVMGGSSTAESLRPESFASPAELIDEVSRRSSGIGRGGGGGGGGGVRVSFLPQRNVQWRKRKEEGKRSGRKGASPSAPTAAVTSPAAMAGRVAEKPSAIYSSSSSSALELDVVAPEASAGAGQGGAVALGIAHVALAQQQQQQVRQQAKLEDRSPGGLRPLGDLKSFQLPKIKVRLSGATSKLVSGAIAGAVSRTAVAPLETIRTLLMVSGSQHKSVATVFDAIMRTDGWKGLFRGNSIQVIRCAPSRAIELYTFETVKRLLTPQDGQPAAVTFPLPLPPSSIAGACAGMASTVIMYPLELVKTRLTVQPEMYRGMVHAFTRIIREEGVKELYRGLTPSMIGIIPYAGANYFAYDALRAAYRHVSKRDRVDHLATLAIGSAAGAFAAASTFPLEVARKQMQMGALNGRATAYKGMLHCMECIVKEEGVKGLYRGLVPSCVKLMPAAGISFMCYEALKRVLMEEEEKA